MSIGAEALSSLPLSGVGGDVYIGDVTVRPSGWCASTFGQAKIALTQKGLRLSTFPTPLAIHNTINVAAGWPSAVFGAPSTIAAATYRAASLGKITVFGTFAGRGLKTCVGGGARITTFGTPRSRGVLHTEATGASMVSFGLADATFTLETVGWKAPHFGRPQVSRSQMAHGFVATRMGHPRMNRTVPFNPILELPVLYVVCRQTEISVRT